MTAVAIAAGAADTPTAIIISTSVCLSIALPSRIPTEKRDERFQSDATIPGTSVCRSRLSVGAGLGLNGD